VIIYIHTLLFLVVVRLSPLPNTPPLRQPKFMVSTTQRFEVVIRFLRKRLQLKDHESVFCYINSCFAPGLDEGVGNLWRVCHLWSKRVVDGGKLIVFNSVSRLEKSWSLATVLHRHLDDFPQ